MNLLKINITKQGNGYNFGISPMTRQEIKARFPNAKPIGHIYVSAEDKWDFEQIHGSLAAHVLPFLTGLERAQLESFADVALFVNSLTNKTEHQIPLNDVEKEQPLFRQSG